MKTTGMIRLSAVVLLGIFSLSTAYGAELKPGQKPPVGPSQPALQPLSPQAVQVQVNSVDPMTVQLEAGKGPATVTLKGSNLDKVTQIEVFQGGQVVKEIQPQLGPPSPSSRQVALSAASGAKPGSYQLRVIGGAQRIDIPVSVANVQVKASSSPPAAAQPGTSKATKVPSVTQTLATKEIKMMGRGAKSKATRVPSVTQTLATKEIKMIGRGGK